MLFNSFSFICIFLPIVGLGFFIFSRFSHHLAAFWLCAASLFFYSVWNIHYLWLLLTSVAYNYGAAYLIRASRKRASWVLTGAIAGDLGLLGYYKYAGFFMQSLDDAFQTNWTVGHIILPLGISFFTFTQIAFLVDTYLGKVREYDFVRYLLFVTYFPHLIAGPILHHAQMMPQFALKRTYRLNWRNINVGVTMFTLGLAKKVLLADMFSAWVRPIFDAVDHGAHPMFFEAWIGALAYTLQLYFDFSGYCDMAIGISYFFNVRLPLNFNSPYKAVNIIDFWRRWHMTLSAFLRDYLYIPLGGNRHGKFRRYINLMITMLLGGLWHGAGWTFVAWGGLHGLYLVLNHAFRGLRAKVGWEDGRFGRAGRVISILITFVSVVVAWVFFRAPDFGTAVGLVRGMMGLSGISLMNSAGGLPPAFVHFLNAYGIVFQGFTPITLFTGPTITRLALGVAIVWFLPNSQEWTGLVRSPLPSSGARGSALTRWQPGRSWNWVVIGLLFAFAFITVVSGPPSEFLYFQF
jgi:alginate O-acetyltransferase complex protein AlgI